MKRWLGGLRRGLTILSGLIAIRLVWVWFARKFTTDAPDAPVHLFPCSRTDDPGQLPVASPAVLVCQGGGAQGAWQAGVISYLLERGIKFKSHHGTSAGALNAALVFAGKDTRDLYRVWCETPWHSIWGLSPFSFLKGGLVSEEPLRRLIARELGRPLLRAAASAGKYLFVWVTDLDEEGPRLVQCQGTGRDEPFEEFLLASCMIPGFFPSLEITDGNGDPGRFCDGGLASNNPLRFIDPSGMAGIPFVIDISPYTRAHGGEGVLNAALSTVMKEQVRCTLLLAQEALESRFAEDHYGVPHFYVIQPSRKLNSGLIPLGKQVRVNDFEVGRTDAEEFIRNPRKCWLKNLNLASRL